MSNMVRHILLYFLSVLRQSIVAEYSEPHVDIPQASRLPPLLGANCICDNDDDDKSYNQENQKISRIAYLVTVHNFRTIEDAALLFRRIRSVHNLIFVHIDTKVNWEVYTNSTLFTEINACPCGSNVVVQSIYSSEWSSWSMNDPTFWGMKEALKRKGEWDVFVNLSGDTYPVYHQSVIGNIFATDLKGINFVTSSSCETGLLPTNVYHFPEWWHKRNHYTTEPEGDVSLKYVDENGNTNSITMQIHFGSQWMAIQPNFCEYIISSLERKDSLASRFRDYLIETKRLMTDETFIPTLLMYVEPFNKTLPLVKEDGSLVNRPNFYHLRYERMDEHVPSAFGFVPKYQHYDVPNSSMPLIDKPKPWGPYYLGVYDLQSIQSSGSLYIRKISKFVEPNLFNILPVHSIEDIPNIGWPDEIAISRKVDWQKRVEKMKNDVQLNESVSNDDESNIALDKELR